MKEEYDFSKGKRGAIVPTPAGKTRITIRLDNAVIEWFRSQVESKGGGNYQTMINNALRECISNRGESFEEIIRRVVKEEIRKVVYPTESFYPTHETAVNEMIRTDLQNFEMESFAGTSAGETELYTHQ